MWICYSKHEEIKLLLSHISLSVWNMTYLNMKESDIRTGEQALGRVANKDGKESKRGTLNSIIQSCTWCPMFSSSTIWLLISIFSDVKLTLLSSDTDPHFLQLQ